MTVLVYDRVADILTGERYVLETTVTQLTLQAGMVLGFALGGVTVAALGTRGALGVDAATFAASALLLTLGVRRRTRSRRTRHSSPRCPPSAAGRP